MRFLKPDFVIIPRICLLHNTPHLETFANVHILVAWFPPFLVFREHCVCLKDCILRLPIIISSIKVTFWQPAVRAQNVRSLNNKSNFQKMAGKMLPHYHGVVLLLVWCCTMVTKHILDFTIVLDLWMTLGFLLM